MKPYTPLSLFLQKGNSEDTKEEVPSATKGKRKRKADEIEDQTHEDVK